MRVAIGCMLLVACGVAWGQPERRKLPPAAATTVPAGTDSLQAATLTLHRCGPAYCGDLTRLLDPSGAVAGTIGIHFEFYPARDQSHPPSGAILATEGGPGYPSTLSRAYYLGLFEPLMDHRSLLLVDVRGTGKSDAVRCTPLQSQPQYTQAAIQACGAEMGNTSDLFGTGLAADDVAAVATALGLPALDVYGDSYGTFFTQAFAARHPNQVRSIVLDSAYAVIGADPWYPEAPPAAANAFNQACARAQTCQGLAGNSMSRIQALLDSIRANPVTGTAPDGDGNPTQATANAQGLAYVMFSNSSGPLVYRDLDAATRAWQSGDTAPFLRLVAENQSASHPTAGAQDVTTFSGGVFTAVSCTDYPQIYNMTLPVNARSVQDQQAIALKQQQDPNVFAPFTINEFLQMPLDYSVVNLCVRWPVPSPAYPPGQPVPPSTPFPVAPVLVLSGDLDSLTPAAQGAQAAALFPHSQQVIVPNSFHVTALGDVYNCASTLVQNFVLTLSVGSTACTASIPEVRLVPQFALHAGDLTAASAQPGNQGTNAELQVAAAAVLTAGDALARWYVNYDGTDVGLRGGTFGYTMSGTMLTFTLDQMQWTQDVAVSGTVLWDLQSGATTGTLNVSGAVSGTLTLSYQQYLPNAMATIGGSLGGHAIAATMYAP